MAVDPTPYDSLTPDVVLSAVEARGYSTAGTFFPLNSYENRVYDIGIDNGPNVIAKFYRPGRWDRAQIGEEHAFAHQLEAAEVPVVPPLIGADGHSLFEYEDFFVALYPKRGGRPMEIASDEDFRHMGRLVARIHTIGSWGEHTRRPVLLPAMGWDNLTELLAGPHIPPDLKEAYETTARQLLEAIETLWGERTFTLRLHGDCHLGNILNDGEPFFVDLDDTMTGPAVQDLWLFLSGEQSARAQQMTLLLEGYTQIREFDCSELWLVEPLRALRMIHYSAWLSRRWEDPTFPRSFPFFTTQEYWTHHLAALREQIATLQEPPLEMSF